jgi:hypothetical protein
MQSKSTTQASQASPDDQDIRMGVHPFSPSFREINSLGLLK